MLRVLSPEEKRSFKRSFPYLDVDAARVTDEETPQAPPPARPPYNCLAWTLGITNTWVWPGPAESDFDRLYNEKGYVRATSGPIAVWGYAPTQMTHGSIRATGPGPEWESKLGHSVRMRHGQDELRSAPGDTTGYGSIRYFYKPRRIRFLLVGLIQLKSVFMGTKRLYLDTQQDRQLAKLVEAVSPEAQDRFEKLYEQWQTECIDSPAVRVASDPAVVKSLPGFIALKDMGQSILPLIAERMKQPHEIFALQLFEEIASESISQRDLAAQELALGEHHRALRNLQHWLAGQ